MISATYFGEITELESRAVWYSDEEDEDDTEVEEDSGLKPGLNPKLQPLEPVTHETFRSNIQLNFRKLSPESLNLKFNSCVISLSSSRQFKNSKLGNLNSLFLLGHYDTVGKAFAFPITNNKLEYNQPDEHLLWLLFDSSHPYISGHEVGYFVEALRASMQSELDFTHDKPIFILSQQFSSNDYLEYLGNFENQKTKLPFSGRPIAPPSLIKNQFESALFEQLTLTLKTSFVVCLPDPKSSWFDKAKDWPSLPDQIIEHKLNDYSAIEKTLIFT